MKKTFLSIFICTLSISIYSVFAMRLNANVNSKEKEKQSFFAHKFLDKQKFHCILAGDSRVYRGLNPIIFEKALHVSTINLGFDSAGYGPDFFRLIEDRLSSEEPRYVIIGISPHSFTQAAANNGQLVEYTRMSPSERQSMLNPTILDQLFPAISIKKLSKSKTESENPALIETYLQNGFAPARMEKNDPTEAVKSYTAIFKENPFYEPTEDLLLQKVTAYAAKGIHIFGVRLPISHELRAVEDSFAGFNESNFIAKFEAGGGHWIQLSNQNYETFDGSHLDSTGADQVSEEISKLVNELLLRPASK